MVKKYLFLLLLLPLVGCIKPSDLRFGGIESTRITALGASQSGLAIALKVANTSGTNLTLIRGNIRLYKGEQLLSEAIVDDKVKLPRKFDGTIEVPIRVRMGDGGLLGMLGTMGILYANGLQGTTVSGSAIVRAGMVRKKISFDNINTDQLLKKLGISWEELKKQIKL